MLLVIGLWGLFGYQKPATRTTWTLRVRVEGSLGFRVFQSVGFCLGLGFSGLGFSGFRFFKGLGGFGFFRV